MIVVVSCILSFNGRREVSSTELDYWLLSRIVINSMGGLRDQRCEGKHVYKCPPVVCF